MDRTLVFRILGWTLIPVVLGGLIALIMWENAKEEVFSQGRERIVVRPPRPWGGWL